MQKAIIALFCIFAVISAFPVNNNGKLALTRTTGGFYTVPAGLDVSPTTGEAAAQINVLVSLFSNKVFVGTNCSGFDVDITDRDVKVIDPATNDTLLLVNNRYIGVKSQANMSLDVAFFNATNNILHGTNCDAINTGDTDLSGNGLGGAVGLGFGGNNALNYGANVPTVSVSLDSNLQAGSLLFLRDAEKIKTLNAALQLATTQTWQINNFSAVAFGTTSFATPDTINRILFDLNTDSIALPSFIWTQVVSALNSTNVVCTNAIYQPTCTITGELSQLPNITITVGEKTIVIPPQAYVINAASYNASVGGTILLGLKSVDSLATTAAKNHISVTFNTSIVFGAPFFSYYYVVLTGNTDITQPGTLELFTSPLPAPPGPTPPGPTPPGPTPTPTPPSSSKWWLVLVILAVILVIVGIYWFVARRNKANKLQEEINNNLLRA